MSPTIRQSTASRVLLPFALVALITTGCSTQGEKMVQSYSKTRDQLAEAQQQVDATMHSLTSLRRTPAERLADAFKRYKDDVDKLELEQRDVRRRAEQMKTEQDEHIKAWQDEMATIKDPTIKSSLDSRRTAARSNFTLIRMYADDVRKTYEPFLKRNKEMVHALSIDLSPAGITSLTPAMDEIMRDGAVLKERLAAMQHGMDNIANGVSPIGE